MVRNSGENRKQSVKSALRLDISQENRVEFDFFLLWLLSFPKTAIPLHRSCETTKILGIRKIKY